MTETTTKKSFDKILGGDVATTGTTPTAGSTPARPFRRKRKKTGWYLLAVLLGGAGAYYGFFAADAVKPVTYRFAAIERGNIVKAVSATGTLQATKTVQVGSQVSGTIQELYADFNSYVKKGQLLAELDPTFYQAAVAEARANLSKATAELENAEREELRARDLIAKQLISQQEYDVVKTRMLNAKGALEQVRAQLQRAQVNLSYTTIRSPISGIVVSRDVDVGQTVAASLNAPVLFKIAEDLTKMQVAANIDEADIGQVKEGQTVKFTVDAYAGEQFVGKVLQTRINPVVQQNVVTYTVIIDAENPERKLLPGLTATVSIVSATQDDVLRLPNAALRFKPVEEASEGASKAEARPERRGGKNPEARGGARSAGKVFIRSAAKDKNGFPVLVPVKVKLGLSDGTYTAIESSDPALKSGDSLAVGTVSTEAPKPAGQSQPGTNPMGGGPRRMRM